MYEIPVPSTSSTITSHLCGGWCDHNTSTNTIWYSNPTTVYLYQIFCPKRGCKEPNWLQLDTMKECVNCGSMLKAVAKKADYEVEVDK